MTQTSTQARKETLAKIEAMVAEGKTLTESLAANNVSTGKYYSWKAQGTKTRVARAKADLKAAKPTFSEHKVNFNRFNTIYTALQTLKQEGLF
jgi:hypothetical protein